MIKYDRISTLFLVGVSIVMCIESIRLGPGSLSSPGPGLIPLGCGIILGILALIIFARTFMGLAKEKKVLWERGTQFGKLISLFASLILYAFLIDLLGFLLVTLLWMSFLCMGLGEMGWKKAVFTSLITAFSCYILFAYFLDIRFPRGIFGF